MNFKKIIKYLLTGYLIFYIIDYEYFSNGIASAITIACCFGVYYYFKKKKEKNMNETSSVFESKKKENNVNESVAVKEVKEETNMESNMIGINEIKKIMKTNKKGPLYEFEHTLLRDLFYDKTNEFIDFILKDKGNVFYLYSKLCKKLNVKSKRSKEDFLHTICTSSKGSIVFCFDFPIPAKIALCRKIYMEVNSNCEALNYYTVEKGMNDNEFVLCAWDSNRNHINYGISDNFEKIIGELKLLEKKVRSFDEILVSINDEKDQCITVIETQREDCKVVEEKKMSEPLEIKKETHQDNSDNDNNKEKIGKTSDSTIKYCRRCGNKLISGSKFCNNCGLKI